VENFSSWKGESQIAAYMRVCGIMELEVVEFNTARTKDGYSSSGFISAILIQVKYITEYWVFITP